MPFTEAEGVAVFDAVRSWLARDAIAELDAAVSTVVDTADARDTQELVNWLMATFSARARLTSRGRLADASERVLADRIGVERTAKIMARMRTT